MNNPLENLMLAIGFLVLVVTVLLVWIYIIVNTLQWIVSLFVRWVPENELWIISNRVSNSPNTFLLQGRYLKFWPFVRIVDEWYYPFTEEVVAESITSDEIPVKRKLKVNIEITNTFKPETFAKCFEEVRRMLKESMLRQIRASTVVDLSKSKILEQDQAQIDKYLTTYGLKITKVESQTVF